MHELVISRDTMRLVLPSGKQLIAQALADDTFLFLKAKAMEVWNVKNSLLIRCTEQDLVDLGWSGRRFFIIQ